MVFKVQLPLVNDVIRTTLIDLNLIVFSSGSQGEKSKEPPFVLYRWTKPLDGSMKMNIDDAWDPNNGMSGISFLIRNFDGMCSFAASFASSAALVLTMEILAIRTALHHLYTCLSQLK